MVIAVSACLLGENCKYNGGNNYHPDLAQALKKHCVIPLCPEVLGGEPVPRKPVEIVEGVVRRQDGSSADDSFRRGAALALQRVKDSGAELVILQSRSPSCGVDTIYDGSFSGTLVPGDGIFAALLKENGIPVKDVARVDCAKLKALGETL